MKLVLIPLLICAIPACSTTTSRPQSQPLGLAARADLTVTRSHLQSVKHATTEIRTSAATIKTDVTSAQISAEEVAKSFEELSSAIKAIEETLPQGNADVARAMSAERSAITANEALRNQLVSANTSINFLTAQAVEADLRIDDAAASATRADAKVVQMTQEDARKAEQIVLLTEDRDKQRGLAWKWRGWCLGLLALAVVFFIARQYFPILKAI